MQPLQNLYALVSVFELFGAVAIFRVQMERSQNMILRALNLIFREVFDIVAVREAASSMFHLLGSSERRRLYVQRVGDVVNAAPATDEADDDPKGDAGDAGDGAGAEASRSLHLIGAGRGFVSGVKKVSLLLTGHGW